MMQVTCQFGKFCSCAVFLSLLFVAKDVAVVVLEVFADLFVLLLDVVEVLLAGVEVVFVLARVVSAITESG